MKIFSFFFVDVEMDNNENKFDCVFNIRYLCKVLICFIFFKLVNVRRNELFILLIGNYLMKKKVFINIKGKCMLGIIYIFVLKDL